MSYQAELSAYVERFGAPSRVEVLVCDCNAIYRGKWFPGSDLEKLMKSGTNFPISLLFGDLTCETPSELLQPPLAGDPDGMYSFVAGSLRNVPWRDVPTAQVQLSLVVDEPLDPRDLLDKWLENNDLNGFFALEGEFVLQGHQTALAGEQVYSHQALEEAAPFIASAYAIAESQNVRLTSVLPEYGDGQFEVNLHHSADPLAAADEYLLSKRVIKAAAQKNGQAASFMALPFTGGAGNGCHIHVSLMSDAGDNLLADEQTMAYVAQGLLGKVSECVALLAPHANSYRRIGQSGEFNAPSATWGENHRGTMLRIPKSDAKNRRVEFRLAGADVNPYLLTLFTLAALKHGLDTKSETQVAKTNEGQILCEGLDIETRWLSAINALDNSDFARSVFGDTFIDTYVRMKRAEEQKFHNFVADMDNAWAANVV